MSMQLESIMFCGPIPLPGNAPGGGYEASNSRTIAALRAAGSSVTELRYPQPTGGKVAKLKGYWQGFGQLLKTISNAPPDNLLHVTGLYKQFVIPEILLLKQARRRGVATVYDIRAGSMFKHYRRLGPVYRYLFRLALRSADMVMIEGQEYASFVEQQTGAKPFYLPNHVSVDESAIQTRADAKPRLVYVGRITVEKGIETILEAARLLAKNGLNCEVAIAGPGDASLLARLKAEYSDLGIEWLGSLQSMAVLAQFGRAHFFMFPTRHSGEGHSNALTEAMAMGCVPLVSENGFNRSVVGDAGRVLALDAKAEAYAAEVLALWEGGRYAALSTLAANRARELFSTEQVVKRLQLVYADIQKGKKK
jgi:glycosyltransferase involved in cell wall biosynthesis